MTAHDSGDVRYEDVHEAEEGLRERGITDETIGEIETSTWVAAEELLRQHDLPDHVEVHSLS